jgi:hypothetical protein
MSDTRSGTPKQSYSTEKSAPNMNLFFAAATKEELAHEQEFPRSYDPKFFLRFLPKDQETNLTRLAQGNPDGLLSWPKKIGLRVFGCLCRGISKKTTPWCSF